MEEARLMILGLPILKEKIPAHEKEASWERLSRTIEKQDRSQRRRRRKRIAWTSAAVIAVLFGSFLWMFKPASVPEMQHVQAAFGEIKTVTLPDASVVTLNAHSSLRYAEHWTGANERLVHLEGEAYFQVASNEDLPFIVETSGIEITVLGTSFNVYARDTDPVVSLVEGKLHIREESGNDVRLHAGEAATYRRDQRIFYKNDLSPSSLSWKQHQWIFDKTTLKSVFERLEDEYGMDVIVKDPKILGRVLSGQVSTNSKQVLFRALEELLALELRESNGQLIVSKR